MEWVVFHCGEDPPLSVRLADELGGWVSQRTSRDYYGVDRRNAGVEADRSDAEAGSRAGRRLTMCPLGRTPLIPLQLEINESLILHPLLSSLPLSLLLLLHPTIMSFSVDDLVASLSGNHIGQEALDLAALQVPFISYSLITGRQRN